MGLSAQPRGVLMIWVSADGLRPQVEAGFLAWGNAMQPGLFSLGSQDTARAPVMGNPAPRITSLHGPEASLHFHASITWKKELMIALSFLYSSPVGICHAVLWKTRTLNAVVCGLIITPSAAV